MKTTMNEYQTYHSLKRKIWSVNITKFGHFHHIWEVAEVEIPWGTTKLNRESNKNTNTTNDAWVVIRF